MIRPAPRPRRPALLSIVMLIGLIVVGLMAGAVIRVAAARRLAIRAEERALQAEALALSAIDRALARRAADPAYPGETWEVPAADLKGRGPARVGIELRPDPHDPAGKILVVVADLLASARSPVRVTRTVRIPSLSPAR